VQCVNYNSSGFGTATSFFSLGLNLTNPPVSHTGPAQISFTPDNSALVVTNKGANPPLFVIKYLDNGTVGASTSSNSSFGGGVPFAFVWDTDGTMVLVDPAPYGTTGGVDLVTFNTTSINFLLPSFFLFNQNATCWISKSAYTGYFYGADAGSASAVQFSRSGNNITQMSVVSLPGSAPIDNTVVSVGGQDYLIQLSGTNQLFVVLTSTMTIVQTVNLGTSHAAGIATYSGSTSGSSAVGSSAVGSSAAGSSAVGSSAVGSSAVGSSAVGSSAVGSSAVGSSAAGSSAVGSSAAGSSAGSKVSSVGSSAGSKSSSSSTTGSASTIILSLLSSIAVLLF